MQFKSAFSLVAIWLCAVPAASSNAQESPKVSEFGKYSGYSEERFAEWHLASQYVTMRDGVRLAVDVVRPAVDGKPIDEKVPVVWTHSRYHRNQQAMAPGRKSMVDGRPDLERLVKHGYAVASVGVRGSGASFGRYEGLFSPNETKDSYEIIKWLAAQPWCDGNVGMFGGSYLGITQYMAASQSPEALKAIFPDVAAFDMYEVIYPGGVYRQDMINQWGKLTRNLDTNWKAAKVQTDPDGDLLKQAIAQHENNWDVIEEYRKAKFRDTRSPEHSYFTHNPAPLLKQIQHAMVPAYHWNGFLDIFVTDATLWYANYHGPQKLGIGPWPHGISRGAHYIRERFALQTVEQHRWFDYWMKGIDNGIMDQPPINYAVLVEPKKWTWHSADQWPPAKSVSVKYFFAEGPSGSVESVNDGQLRPEKPAAPRARDQYAVDLTTTTGTSSRWDNAVGAGPMHYGDMTRNDRKSLTYTTAPLEKDVTVVGHPVVNLHVETTANDCDFYVLLQEVDQEGKSNYVTEGVLRGSHRTTTQPPWNNLKLPYQRSYKDDKRPLNEDTTVELKMDLHPTAVVFNAGNRIRVTVMCADKDNTEVLQESDGNEIFVRRDTDHPSHIVLPIVE